MWLFVAWLMILLFVVVPYMIRHPPDEGGIRPSPGPPQDGHDAR
jgi:hypothetical protein